MVNELFNQTRHRRYEYQGDGKMSIDYTREDIYNMSTVELYDLVGKAEKLIKKVRAELVCRGE